MIKKAVIVGSIGISLFALSNHLVSQPGWGPDIRLVYLPGGSWYPRADALGDSVHLVWYQNYLGHEEVYYKRSTDAGFTWSDDVLLSVVDDIESIVPDIAVKGDTLIVAWNEFNQAKVAFRISEDGGETFGAIDSIKGPGLGYPSLAMVDDTVYMAIYCFASYPGISYTSSRDGGVTWDSLKQLYNDAFQPCRIAVTWPDVHIVFTADDPITGELEVFYIGSHDGGRTWDDAIIISHQDNKAGQFPSITSWSRSTGVVWFDYKYSPYPWTGDIFFRKRNKLGRWSEIDSLTIYHRAVYSDILAERTHLHVVWEDERDEPGENVEIYYRESPDLGVSWSSDVRLTNAPHGSQLPSLACGSGFLHLFWRDRRDLGSGAIYYKRKDLSVIISEIYKGTMPKFLKVSPNPFRDKTSIYFSLTESLAYLEIFDETGRKVFSRVISGEGKHNIEWQTIKVGIYFVRLKTKQRTILEKIVALR